MLDFTFSYLDTLRAFGRNSSLRDLGLSILSQSDEPVNWFDSALDWSAGMAFQQFVADFKSVAPKGKYPPNVRCRIDGKHVTVSLPSGNLAVTV